MLLMLHLIGAVAAVAIGLVSLLRPPRSVAGATGRIKLCAGSAVLQTVTGVGLVVSGGPAVSIPATCVRGVMMLAVMGLIMAYLSRVRTRLQNQ